MAITQILSKLELVQAPFKMTVARNSFSESVGFLTFRCPILVGSVALSLTLGSLLASNAHAEATFTQPGTFMAEDIDVKQLRGTWFAIHLKGRIWYLSKTTVTTVNDKNGIVNIRGTHPNTIGLLRGVELTEGPLESASLGVKNASGVSNSFRYRGQQYSLAVQAVPFKYYSKQLNETFDNIRNDVYFSNGTHRTLVYGGGKFGRSCEHPSVLWAGDIDRDGKPDVVAYFSDDSQRNGSTCAFLSSTAKPGRLLKNAGCQFASG